MNLVEITVQKKSPCHGITYNAGFNSCNRNRCIDESVCTFRRERSTEQYYFYIYQHNVPECFEDDCRPGSIFLHSMLHFPIWRSERSRTIGGKIMGFYLLTTVLAILTATGVFELLKPGNPELAAKTGWRCSCGVGFGCKYFNKDTIVGIIPAKLCKTVF